MSSDDQREPGGDLVGPTAGGTPPVAGPPDSPAFRSVKGAIRYIDYASFVVVAAAMAAMSIMVAVQVFFRYVLGSSIDSADELSRLFFVWTIFLAIPHGVKLGVHVGIDLFVLMMPHGVRAFLFRATAAAGAGLMCLVMFAAWTATLDRWPELMPTLPITSAVYYIAVLISAGHAFLHLALLTWGGPRSWEEELG